jgi:hypothetical protein
MKESVGSWLGHCESELLQELDSPRRKNGPGRDGRTGAVASQYQILNAYSSLDSAIENLLVSHGQALSAIVYHGAHGATDYRVVIDLGELARSRGLVGCQSSVWHREALVGAVDNVIVLVLGQPRGIGRRPVVDSNLDKRIRAIRSLVQLQRRDSSGIRADIEVDGRSRRHETAQG